MADKLFNCEDVDFDYRFSTCLAEKHFKLKWVVTNVSKIPCNKPIPSPVFQLLSEGECNLQLLNDLGDMNVYLYNANQPITDQPAYPCVSFEYEITRYSTALFDVNGQMRKRSVLYDRNEEVRFLLLRSKGLDTLKDDTLIVAVDIAADVLCNTRNEISTRPAKVSSSVPL